MLKLEKIMILLLLINSSCLSPRSPRSSYLSSVSVDPEPTELILPTVIADHMVFQESQPIVIWGLAKPEAEVEILFGPEGEPTSFDKKVTRANSKGQWKVDFPPRKADLTPLAIEIKSLNKRVTIRDVLIGELWLAGGQSNMELNVQNSLYGENLIREAKEPSLRIFTQEHVGPQFGSRPSQTPVFSNEGGLWSLGSNEKAVARSSAASYVFAKTLFERWRSTGVTKPIGIVNAAVGNTSAASWLSKETLLQSSELKHLYPASWQVSPSTQGGPLPYLQPTAAYNHKIYPLRYLNFRGVIFSQGESNVGNEAKAHLYEISLVKLIKSWRELWNNQELIFILTTLPAAASSCPTPERLDHEAFTREAQSLVTEELPLTLSIPIHDVEATWDYGDWPYKHPIHPLNKNAVGIRLAEAAWGFAYQKTQDFVPPKMIQTETKQDAMIVTFFDQGGSLQVLPPGKSIKGFALAGADRVFYPAQARIIDGQRIEVRSPKVSSPRFVTYGFTQMNQAANLYGTKMPALPFRSDKTPGTYLRIKPFYPYEGELQPNSLGENTRSSIEKNPEATRGIFRRVIAQGQGGSITLSLTVPHDGTFDMDLLTTFSGEEGDLQVSLNSQPPVQVTPPRATAKGLREISLFRKVSLKKGVLQLKLNLVPSPSAKGAMALEIDQIRLRSECPQHLSLFKDWL